MTIITVIADAFIQQKVPPTLHIVSVIIGTFGALILSMPDEMYACFYCLIKCKKYKDETK